MAPAPVFRGRVEIDRGAVKLSLEPGESDRRLSYLRSIAGDVEVVYRKRRSRRSIDQNAYLHAVPFRMIAEYTGDDIESVKIDVMGECWGYRRSDITGRDVPVKAQTSMLSAEETSWLIEWIPPWALRMFGLEIPLPERADY